MRLDGIEIKVTIGAEQVQAAKQALTLLKKFVPSDDMIGAAGSMTA